MECPKCGCTLLDADPAECTRCGVVIAKFLRAHQESFESAVELPPLLLATHAAAVAPENESAARSERIARAVALPLALLFAWDHLPKLPHAFTKRVGPLSKDEKRLVHQFVADQPLARRPPPPTAASARVSNRRPTTNSPCCRICASTPYSPW